MTKNLIEIKNKDQFKIIISQIEYCLDYIDIEDEAIEAELEEKYKDEIKYFKENYINHFIMYDAF